MLIFIRLTFLLCLLAKSNQQLSDICFEETDVNINGLNIEVPNSQGYFGNDVIYRPIVFVSHAQGSWIDMNTILPAGELQRFFVHVSNNWTTYDESFVTLRLQIWRPIDLANLKFTLVWQARVKTIYNRLFGRMYTFFCNSSVPINSGDRIGWTYEGIGGPISLDNDDNSSTLYYQSVSKVNNNLMFPEIGNAFTFQKQKMKFSIAVQMTHDNVITPSTSKLPTINLSTTKLPTTSLSMNAIDKQNIIPVLNGSDISDVFLEKSEDNFNIGLKVEVPNSQGYFGNDVIYRHIVFVSHAQGSWIDMNTVLPAGNVKRFFVYVSNNWTTYDESFVTLRLQIWRPIDLANLKFALVWQARVKTFNDRLFGRMDTFLCNSSVPVNSGDRIGWTYEGIGGPIPVDNDENSSTLYYQSNFDNLAYPKIGNTFAFERKRMKFSIAVQMDSV